MAISTVELICETCSQPFIRRAAEHKRNIRVGRKTYCSNRCSASRPEVIARITSYDHARFLQGSKDDDCSPFRWHLRNARRRGKECSIILDDLKEQWENQKGICPYTGWQLINLPNTNYKNQLPLTPNRASLDRIDSQKGYVKGNIQFIAVIAQYGKHKFSEKDFVNFILCAAANLKG